MNDLSRQLEDAVVVLVDLEETAFHLDANAILARWVGWYSPRVPAGETSSILEAALLGDFAFPVGDGKRRFGRSLAVN